MIGLLLLVGLMIIIIKLEKREIHNSKKKIINNPTSGKDWYYNTYLKSEHWKKRRAGALYKANFHCQCCGETENLQVHHLSYKNIWHELDNDLKVVCRSCHMDIHNIKKGAA